MRFILFLLFFLIPNVSNADTLIGFKGMKGAFDSQAFNKFALKYNMKGIAYDSYKVSSALLWIKKNRKEKYALYGFSLGAKSTMNLMKEIERNKLPRPMFIITIGAYKTVDVNFSRFNIRFANYFDDSGLGNKSPGKYLKYNHFKMQGAVNKIHSW